MDDFEKSFTQIKQLSTAVTEENYYDCGKQGYDILVRIHDSAVPQERVYNAFFEHYTSLQEGLSKDWFADMLDYICGWTAPQWHIWRSDGAFKRTK